MSSDSMSHSARFVHASPGKPLKKGNTSLGRLAGHHVYTKAPFLSAAGAASTASWNYGDSAFNWGGIGCAKRIVWKEFMVRVARRNRIPVSSILPTTPLLLGSRTSARFQPSTWTDRVVLGAHSNAPQALLASKWRNKIENFHCGSARYTWSLLRITRIAPHVSD
jgi:hypothetical protein